MPYKWLEDPTHGKAEEEITRDLEAFVQQEEQGRIGDLDHMTPEEERSARVRLRARVEHATLKRTAQVAALADRSLRWQAVQAAQSGLHRYHDEEFDSVGEMFKSALDGVERGSSSWHDLKFIAEELYPWGRQHGIPGLEGLWRDGNIEKTRLSIPYFRTLTDPANPSSLEERVRQTSELLSDVLTLSGPQFDAKYPRHVSRMAPIVGYQYVYPQGGYIVLTYQDETQLRFIERQLGRRLDLHLGTGQEEFIPKLLNQKHLK